MFVLFLVFLLINYSNAQNEIIIKEYISKYGVPFLQETDDFEIISANSTFEYGQRHKVIRYFGVAKNERENYRFDVCVPIDDCLSGYGYIELCILTNTTTPRQKGKCPEYFSSVKFEYFGKHNKVFNASESIADHDDTYFRIVGEYEYQVPGGTPYFIKNIPKKIKFYRKNIICLTAFHEFGWPSNASQIRFAQPDDTYGSIAGSFKVPKCYNCGADPWATVPFDSDIHPFQTVVIFQDSSSICTPSVILNLPEYMRVESSKPNATIKARTKRTITTATKKESTATSLIKVPKSTVYDFISSKDWIPMLIAAAFICFLIPQFIIGSIILKKRLSRKVDKFYLMVLEMRQNVRKEILQNQKEALEAEKREKKAEAMEERKLKILQLRKKLVGKLSKKNQKAKYTVIQTPKNSTAGSSRIGKREIVQKEVEDIGASTKEDEESNVQLVKDKNETSKTGSISKKVPTTPKQSSFSDVKKNVKKDV